MKGCEGVQRGTEGNSGVGLGANMGGGSWIGKPLFPSLRIRR